ncbi:Anthranilate phosphoribosyltransferase [compost metagenome]
MFIQAARETGILYAAAEKWCPPLKSLRPIREELGLRTVLNTAEKLIDYSCSPYLAIGVYHNTVIDRLSRLLSRLNYRKAIIIQGPEGSEELFIDRPTRVFIVKDDVPELHVIHPESMGLDITVPDMLWTPALQLQVTEEVLRGDAELGFMYQVLLNGAFRLYHADRVNSLEEGLYVCKALLESGEPWELYGKWRACLV